MKKMKKVIAVIMAVIIAMSCMSVLGYSTEKEYVPTIIIPGLFQSETYHYENGEVACDANGVPLARPFYVSISEQEITDIVTNALLPIAKMFITQQDKDALAAKEVSKILAGILMDKMAQDEVLRKSALHDGEQIFENSVFAKAYDRAAMDSFKESREVFGTLFSDPKKYSALKKALAAIMYRAFRQEG